MAKNPFIKTLNLSDNKIGDEKSIASNTVSFASKIAATSIAFGSSALAATQTYLKDNSGTTYTVECDMPSQSSADCTNYIASLISGCNIFKSNATAVANEFLGQYHCIVDGGDFGRLTEIINIYGNRTFSNTTEQIECVINEIASWQMNCVGAFPLNIAYWMIGTVATLTGLWCVGNVIYEAKKKCKSYSFWARDTPASQSLPTGPLLQPTNAAISTVSPPSL